MKSEEYKKLIGEIYSNAMEEKLSLKTQVRLEAAWLKTQTECWKCHTKENLTVDHIIPKSILEQFDFWCEFNEENLSCLCRRCNQFKSSRLDFANPKTKALLQKYVARL